jgi:hypothetical protein
MGMLLPFSSNDASRIGDFAIMLRGNATELAFLPFCKVSFDTSKERNETFRKAPSMRYLILDIELYERDSYSK